MSLQQFPCPGGAAGRLVAGLLALLLLVSACTVRLAPEFDRDLLDGLVEANRQTMTLFADVAGGGDAAGLAERDRRYGEIIGHFEALRVEAQARPVPRSRLVEFLGLGGDPESPDAIARLSSPTPDVLAQIAELITWMRQTDREGGLTEAKVKGFKNSYEIGIAQALVYEKALER